MSLTELDKVFSVSSRLPWVLLDLLSVVIVFVADEAQLLNEQIIWKSFRSLVVLNVTRKLRVLWELDQFFSTVHLQFVKSPRIVSIELFQAWLDPFIVSAISFDDWIGMFAIFIMDIAANERVGESIVAAFCAPHNNLPKLIDERCQIQSWFWRRDLTAEELLEVAWVRGFETAFIGIKRNIEGQGE